MSLPKKAPPQNKYAKNLFYDNMFLEEKQINHNKIAKPKTKDATQ